MTALLMEDDEGDEVLLRHSLRSGGLDVRLEVARSVADGTALLAERRYDVVLLDLGLPDADGLEALHAVVATAPTLPIVVLTGLDDPDHVGTAAVRQGAQDFLVKGSVRGAELARAIRYAIEREELQRQATARTLESTALGILESSGRQLTELDEFLRTAAAVLDSAIEVGEVAVVVDGRPDHGAAEDPAESVVVVDGDVSTIPIVGTTGPLGHIRVTARPDAQLETAQREFLVVAADTIAGVVDRRSTELALSARTRSLRTMHAIASLLRDAQDPGEVVNAVAAMTAAVLPEGTGTRVTLAGHSATAGTAPVAQVAYEHPVLVDGAQQGTVAELGPGAVTEADDDRDHRALLEYAADQLGGWLSRLGARQAHAAEAERLREVLRTAPVGLVVTDDDGAPLYVNPAARRLLGVEDGEPFPIELVRPTELPTRGHHLTVTRPDEQRLTISVDATPLVHGDGSAVLALTDQTSVEARRGALEAALDHEQEAIEELRKVAVLKDTFLHAVSHELRTPLSAVLGYAETLLDHEAQLEPKLRRAMVERVHRNAGRLRSMLEDLLDVGRLTAGASYTIKVSDVDLADVVASALEGIVPGDHRVVVDTPTTPARVDRAKVERMVDNLVRNAVAHTPSGCTVWVRLQTRDDVIDLIVEDDGPGIDDDLREDLWLPFRQGPPAPELELTAQPGTGIGLSLVRAFAQLHGGNATAGERDGGGARFVITLPQQPGGG